MSYVPRAVLADLRRHQLPLGPLAQPLRYHATAQGKLHANPHCRRITSATVERVAPRMVEAGQAGSSQMCTTCWGQLPQPAMDHVRWATAAKRALMALANAGVASTVADTYAERAARHRQEEPHWRDVARLMKAGVGLRGIEQPHRDAPAPEMATVLQVLAGEVAAAEAALRARLSVGSWAAPDRPVVLALHWYAPHRSLESVYGVDELLAMTTLVSALPAQTALALAGANLAQRVPRSSVLGPAEPGDDRAVLETALRLALEGTGPDSGRLPQDVLLASLEAARLIHAPAAG